MSEKKLVYANIRVPIEIKGDSYEIHSDYMNIEFEICPELPEKSTSDNQAMIQKIFSIHSQTTTAITEEEKQEEKQEKQEEKQEEKEEEEEEILKIFASDFTGKKSKVRQNSSFKGNRNRTREYTRRNYH
jgi:membrane protein involved in colicin uptake